MARRKTSKLRRSAPKLPKGGGHFERTGSVAGPSVVGRKAALKSAKTAKARKAGFNAKHPRKSNGKFRKK